MSRWLTGRPSEFQTNPRGIEAMRPICSYRYPLRFRRTLGGLKHGGHVRSESSEGFQTNPRGIEATVVRSTLFQFVFQTNPRRVEASRENTGIRGVIRFEMNPFRIEATAFEK